MGNDALDRLKNIRDRKEQPRVPAREERVEQGQQEEPSTRAPIPEDIETKRMPLQIEIEVWQDITRTCGDLGVSKDVFFEALYLYYQRNAEALGEVAAEASQRRERRVEVGNRKRLRSLQEKYQ